MLIYSRKDLWEKILLNEVFFSSPFLGKEILCYQLHGYTGTFKFLPGFIPGRIRTLLYSKRCCKGIESQVDKYNLFSNRGGPLSRLSGWSYGHSFVPDRIESR